jgi:hypothetical protein
MFISGTTIPLNPIQRNSILLKLLAIYTYKTHFNIILSSIPRSFKWLSNELECVYIYIDVFISYMTVHCMECPTCMSCGVSQLCRLKCVKWFNNCKQYGWKEPQKILRYYRQNLPEQTQESHFMEFETDYMVTQPRTSQSKESWLWIPQISHFMECLNWNIHLSWCSVPVSQGTSCSNQLTLTQASESQDHGQCLVLCCTAMFWNVKRTVWGKR